MHQHIIIIFGPQGSGKTRLSEKLASAISKTNIGYVYPEYLHTFYKELGSEELFEREYSEVDVIVLDEVTDIEIAKSIATRAFFKERTLIIVTQTTTPTEDNRRFQVIQLPIPEDEKQMYRHYAANQKKQSDHISWLSLLK